MSKIRIDLNRYSYPLYNHIGISNKAWNAPGISHSALFGLHNTQISRTGNKIWVKYEWIWIDTVILYIIT